jgi:hypothetical protein
MKTVLGRMLLFTIGIDMLATAGWDGLWIMAT